MIEHVSNTPIVSNLKEIESDQRGCQLGHLRLIAGTTIKRIVIDSTYCVILNNEMLLVYR